MDLLVPFPRKVLLDCELAEKAAANYLKSKQGKIAIPRGVTPFVRSFLRNSTELKRDLRKSGMGTPTASALCLSPMPRWVWVTEVGDASSLSGSRPDVVRGLFVQDSAGVGNSGEDYVAILLGPRLMLSPPEATMADEDKVRYFEVDNATPWRRLERSAF